MSSASQFSRSSRTAVYLALILAVAMVVAVLVGAKMVYQRVAQAPVSMTELPAPLADSPQCQELLAALPDKVLDSPRAQLVEPSPAGAAAWAKNSTQRVTLRCGVDLPLQYDEYAETIENHGLKWLPVRDTTPGSELSTWYTINTEAIVAVTTDLGDPLDDLSAAVAKLRDSLTEQHPAPAGPLKNLAAGESSSCTPLLDHLPNSPVEGYTRLGELPVWTRLGYEPIVLRCGVAPPENYEAGLRLIQVNAVPWFEDTTLANGTTASTWFALGRSTDIALSLPQAVADEAIPVFSQLIAEHTPEEKSPEEISPEG